MDPRLRRATPGGDRLQTRGGIVERLRVESRMARELRQRFSLERSSPRITARQALKRAPRRQAADTDLPRLRRRTSAVTGNKANRGQIRGRHAVRERPEPSVSGSILIGDQRLSAAGQERGRIARRRVTERPDASVRTPPVGSSEGIGGGIIQGSSAGAYAGSGHHGHNRHHHRHHGYYGLYGHWGGLWYYFGGYPYNYRHYYSYYPHHYLSHYGCDYYSHFSLRYGYYHLGLYRTCYHDHRGYYHHYHRYPCNVHGYHYYHVRDCLLCYPKDTSYVIHEQVATESEEAEARVLELPPGELSFCEGWTLLRVGDHDGAAEAFYNAGLEIPQSGLVQLFLAFALAADGEFELAGPVLARAHEFNPALSSYRWNTAEHLGSDLNHEAVVEGLRAHLQTVPNDFEAWTLLAMIQLYAATTDEQLIDVERAASEVVLYGGDSALATAILAEAERERAGGPYASLVRERRDLNVDLWLHSPACETISSLSLGKN